MVFRAPVTLMAYVYCTCIYKVQAHARVCAEYVFYSYVYIINTQLSRS